MSVDLTIDGAVAKARTAAFFTNNQAPLTSRTIRFISQSTITQREVESSPDVADPNSPVRGPGYVAPIGLGNHFPAGVFNAHKDAVPHAHEKVIRSRAVPKANDRHSE